MNIHELEEYYKENREHLSFQSMVKDLCGMIYQDSSEGSCAQMIILEDLDMMSSYDIITRYENLRGISREPYYSLFDLLVDVAVWYRAE